jgi:phosphoserine phosphatase RsbU/P
VAREVQEGLFPRHLPEIDGLEYGAMWRPARDVGGDYYDFLALPGGRLSVVIGDIAGKGVAAALLMAGLQALVRGQTILSTGDLGALTAAINRIFYQASPANCYATLFYGCYDPSSRRLDFVNAGHEPPFILRRDQVIDLQPGGSVVGLFPDPVYEPAFVTLDPGDVLFAFTDGITEMMDRSKSEWGRERLLAVARECRDLSATDAVARIVGAADEFGAGSRQHDDMTLLVLRVVR